MAPPGSEDPSSEEDPYPPFTDLVAPAATVQSSIPVAGFSHDVPGSFHSAHNTTLGGSVLDHRQPPAAPGTRDTSLPSLDASAASCSTPSIVTRARGVHESTAPSLSSSLPTYHCRHGSTSESGVTFTAPLPHLVEAYCVRHSLPFNSTLAEFSVTSNSCTSSLHQSAVPHPDLLSPRAGGRRVVVASLAPGTN
ncbi:hypothetical protein AB1Y20_009868 [Prymnesium parvum]|uniref:UBX domain-containing protein n=1 Tax=Prymnesium parvum TaxID=97485 RepID=A0AB34K2T5_PRYPA